MKPLAACLLCVLSPAAAQQTDRVRTAAIVVFDGVELLDFAGPAEVLSHVGVMKKVGGRPALDVIVVAPRAGEVRSQNRVRLVADQAIADCTDVDVLVIPGGATRGLQRDQQAMAALARLAEGAEVCLSVCTGAHVLGQLGLLDGKRSTTHWSAIRSVQARYPETEVVADRVVDAGRVVTSAGVSAGIDGALHVVDRLYGRELAEHTADYMEYDWRRDVQPERFAGRRSAAVAYGQAVQHVRAASFGDALKDLGRAFESGFTPANAVLRDASLRPMREDADARQALSTLLKKHAASSRVTMVDRDEPGRKIRLHAEVVDAESEQPLPGALVQLFHTDAGGEYRPGMDAGGGAGNPRLFGYVRTDANGRFTVDTIMPERYPNSTVPRHIHYHVWADGYPEFVSECFFDSDPLLTEKTRADAPRRGFPIVKLETDQRERMTGELKIRVTKR